MDFIDYIAGLAPEGETALVVQQKPTRQQHADGTPKYTYLPYLPDDAPTKGALYLNTGSFILDRMATRLSASRENCEYVLCMMLDDIGTKSKEPPLAPTWIMETSEGSFQWGYAFSEQPSKGEFTAAIRAIARAGYTDPGATNAVRNFRVPGSVNLKPGRNGFEARLVAFHPDREYTLDDICEALGVTPDEADSERPAGIRLTDTGHDSVLDWLNEQGLVLSRVNAEGWCGVVCPNHAEHSDGSVEARYNPLNRAFCCYHGHCEGLDSNAFMCWVADNGGPSVQPGLRDDVMANVMGEALGKLANREGMFTKDSDAEAHIQEVEQRQSARVAKADWFRRFVYVETEDAYFDIETRRELKRAVFNALFRHVPCSSVHSKRRVEASIFFDENRVPMGGRSIVGLTYAPGEGALVAMNGDVFANRWRDARPDVSGIQPGNVTPWLDHLRVLIPEDHIREHVLDVMAFKVQNPGVKISHAVLHGGDEGCGKDTAWAPFLWAVCGPSLRNRALVDGEGITGTWGYHIESEVLVLNEMKEPDARERRAMANKLKPLIAAPPDTLPVNRKGLHPYDAANRLQVLAFTNEQVPISISSQDRRWLCVWSDAPRMDPTKAAELWSWFNAGGVALCARFLHDRDVSAFNPKAAPPWTMWKEQMIDHSMTSAESWLTEMIRERRGEFYSGVISGALSSICDRLQGMAPSSVKLYPAALLYAFKEAGWVDMGKIGSGDFPTKKQVFARKDLAQGLSKSELRRMAEGPDGAVLRVVK